MHLSGHSKHRPLMVSARRASRHAAAASIVTLALSVAACGGPELSDAEIAQLSSAIISGKLDNNHRSVGVLLTHDKAGNELFCTATAIGGKTILTAAHCLHGIASAKFLIDPTPTPAKGVYDASETYQVVETFIHPDYDDQAKRPTHDIAIATLDGIPSVPIIPLSTTTPIIGKHVDMVGFGATDGNSDPDGIRRITDSYVTSAFEGSAGTNLELASNAPGRFCTGDSGGPTFATGAFEVQIGVHSHVLDEYYNVSCSGRPVDTRVDAYVPWIQQTAGADVVTAATATSSSTSSSGSDRVTLTSNTNTNNDAAPVGLGCNISPGPHTNATDVIWLGVLALALGLRVRSTLRRRARTS